MEDCSNCEYPLHVGEVRCPNCGFGSGQWDPDDEEDDDPGLGRVTLGP